MDSTVRVVPWNGFRLMRPIAADGEGLLAMIRDRTLGFEYQDDPALYVRKMMHRLQNGVGYIDWVEGEPPGQKYRIDWHGFEDAVRRHLGDDEAALATSVLTALADDPARSN